MNVKEIIDLLTMDQREVVNGSAFSGILTLVPFKLDLEMLSWLVSSFNTETACVTVSGQCVPVTTVDVVACFGIPQDGRDLSNYLLCTHISSALEDELNIPLKDGCILYNEVQ